MKSRCYSELKELYSFEERFDYLKLDGEVAKETFGYDRYLNQAFYKSNEWKSVRDHVIYRDNGCDLGVDGYEILGTANHRPRIYIHHMIPITREQILERDPIIFDPEYLITCTHQTHNAIHYGDDSFIVEPNNRTLNDTCPWKV